MLALELVQRCENIERGLALPVVMDVLGFGDLGRFQNVGSITDPRFDYPRSNFCCCE